MKCWKNEFQNLHTFDPGGGGGVRYPILGKFPEPSRNIFLLSGERETPMNPSIPPDQFSRRVVAALEKLLTPTFFKSSTPGM